jgi:hypothetical protein
MSEIKRSGAIKKGSSGDHPIMREVRARLANIRDEGLNQLSALNTSADKLLEKIKEDSNPPGDEDSQGLLKKGKDKDPVDEEGDTLPGIQVSVPTEDKKDGKS